MPALVKSSCTWREHRCSAQPILAKAFRSELMPQDPDDEPANVLLERIQDGREDGEFVYESR